MALKHKENVLRLRFHPAFVAALDGAAKVLGMNLGTAYDINSKIEGEDGNVHFNICCQYFHIKGLTTGRTNLVVEGTVKMESGIPARVEFTTFFIDTSHPGVRFKRLKSFLLLGEGLTKDYWCLAATLGNQVSLSVVNRRANS